MSARVPMELTGFDGGSYAVTGGSSGIGLAVTLLLASAGARVVAGDVNEESLAALETTAKAQELDVVPFRLDVTDEAGVAAFVKASAERGDLHGAVTAAGVSPNRPLLEMSLEEWEGVLKINLTGTFLVTNAVARTLAGSGGGAIVTIASAAPYRGTPGLGHYNASKAGVGGLSRTLARELGPEGVRVNCVAPGAVDTPLFRARATAGLVNAEGPLGRIGRPDDLAWCIAFLLSEQSSWITGQTVHVNGGTLMP